MATLLQIVAAEAQTRIAEYARQAKEIATAHPIKAAVGAAALLALGWCASPAIAACISPAPVCAEIPLIGSTAFGGWLSRTFLECATPATICTKAIGYGKWAVLAIGAGAAAAAVYHPAGPRAENPAVARPLPDDLPVQAPPPPAAQIPQVLANYLASKDFSNRFEYAEGTIDQYNISEDKASCTFCAFASSKSFLSSPDLVLNPVAIDANIAAGVREKSNYNAVYVADQNEHMDLQNAALSFPLLHNLGCANGVLPVRDKGKSQYLLLLQELGRNAQQNRGVAAAALIKGQTSLMLGADLRDRDHPKYIIADSHGMNIPEYKGKAYAASFDTPDAVARFMPILYPPMDLGGGFLQDAYNSYNIMFLKSAEQGAEEQDVKAAD